MRSLFLRPTLATFALLPFAACLPDAPAEPSWAEHVEPILQTNCVRCHGDQPVGGAPPTFRLDVFDDTVDSQGRFRRGLNVMAPFVGARAGTMGEMPPGGPELNSYQRDVLTNWGEIGLAAITDPSQLAKLRGERAANRPPTASAQTRFEGDELIVTYEIVDADRDIVTAALTLGGATSVAFGLHAGRGEVRVDTAAVLPGDYPVVVNVDDGFGGIAALEVGTVSIAHANTAAHASVENPTTDALVAGTALFPVSVRVFRCSKVNDTDCGEPDGPETYTLDVFAVRGDEQVQLATAVPVVFDGTTFPDEKLVNVDLDAALLAEAPNWRIRAVVSDGTTTRAIEGGAFIVGRRTTTYTFADVKPLFAKYCEFCHASDAAPGAPNATAVFIDRTDDDTYRATVARGDLFRRVVEYQVMPPKSAIELVGVPQPTQEEREMIEDWLLGGAP